MYILPRVVLFCSLFMLMYKKVAAQDVSINISAQPAAIVKGSSSGRLIVDICNNDGGTRVAAANKLRPLISFPSSLIGNTVVPIAISGWVVLSNDGQNIRLENSVALAPGTCSQIEIGYTGIAVGGPLTITGTLGFNGPQTTGNLTGNDNSTTSVTVYLDTDSDGIGDIIDLDDDNDGILDTVENAQLSSDTDADGVPNRIDLDSDNDGIRDVAEALGVDLNEDGMVDGAVNAQGVPLAAAAGLGVIPPDADFDGKPNPYDVDSNNDGISDLLEAGLNPNWDINNDGKIDCTTNCDTDGDGVPNIADGSSGDWKAAPIPDLTPTTEINSLEFAGAASSRDIIVNVFEKNDVQNIPGNIIGFRITKISGFDITYSLNTGSSNVSGVTNNSNGDWTFSENTFFITVMAKSGISIPPNSFKKIGFTVTRKEGIPANTTQNITVTILYGSAGEGKVDNNIVQTQVTAN